MKFLQDAKAASPSLGHPKRGDQWNAGLLNLVVLFAILAVAYTDWIVVANVSLGYLYVLPIALSALVNPLPITVALAVICTALQEIFGPPADSVQVRLVRLAVAIVGFLIVGLLVTLIAKQRERLAAEVRLQRDAYERDLVLASQVQRQVLSKPPVVPGLELAAAMQPARLLGGDYYDFFKISECIVDVVIADVSGKGAAASLLMPSLAVALRLRARELSGPAAIIKDLDGVLKQITNPATFVTMFYGRFDTTRMVLHYANGGHNPPLLVRRSSGESWLLEEAGPIIGILEDAQFSDASIALKSGDILAMFTDGVTEQENAAGEQFSAQRFKEIVIGDEGDSATGLVDAITGAVSAFAGSEGQADDLTVVICKVR